MFSHSNFLFGKNTFKQDEQKQFIFDDYLFEKREIFVTLAQPFSVLSLTVFGSRQTLPGSGTKMFFYTNAALPPFILTIFGWFLAVLAP